MYLEVENYLLARIGEFAEIPAARHDLLVELAGFVQSRVLSGKAANLNFICTHNSRRSHLSQIWAQVAASYYNVSNVFTYSGGTEATAFNPRAVQAIAGAGLEVQKTGDEGNPLYLVSYTEDVEPMRCFSKRFDNAVNPQEDFCAVMTCSEADAACPFVAGATTRLPIRYEDPKAFDDTARESAMYAERCRQIAVEMLRAFSLVGPAKRN